MSIHTQTVHILLITFALCVVIPAIMFYRKWLVRGGLTMFVAQFLPVLWERFAIPDDTPPVTGPLLLMDPLLISFTPISLGAITIGILRLIYRYRARRDRERSPISN